MEHTLASDLSTLPNIYTDQPGQPVQQDNQLPRIYDVPAQWDTTLPREILEQRAEKADYALRTLSPGRDRLSDAFTSGNEPAIREQTAATLDQQAQNNRVEAIKNIAQKGPENVSEQEQSYILNATSGTKHDPQFVLEGLFAKNWLADNTYSRPDATSVFRKATETPEGASSLTRQQASSIGLLTANQALIANHEKLISDYKKKPLLSFTGTDKLTDFVTNAIPFYQWAFTQNVLNKAGITDFFPGSNIEAQVQYGWAQIFAGNGKTVIDKINELYTRNPTAAIALSKAMMSYSFNDKWTDNVLAGLDVSTIGGPLVKGIATRAINIARNAAAAREVMSSADVTAKAIAARKAAGEAVPTTPVGRVDYETPTTYRNKYNIAQPVPHVTPTFYKNPEQLSLFEMEQQHPLTPLLSGNMKSEVQTRPGLPTDMKTSARYETYDMAGDIINPPWEDTKYAQDTYQLGYPYKYQPQVRDARGKFLRRPSQMELPLEGGGKGELPFTEQRVLPLEEPPTRSPTTTEGTSTGKLVERQTTPFNATAKVTLPEEVDNRKLFYRTGPGEPLVALREIVKAGSTPTIDMKYSLNTMGNVEAAITHMAGEEIKQRMAEATGEVAQQNSKDQLKNLVLNAAHALQPWSYYEPVAANSGEGANRFLDAAIRRSEAMRKALENSAQVTRYDPEVYSQIIEQSRQHDMKTFKHVVDGIINAETKVIYPDQTLTNVGYHKYTFGKTDQTLFADKGEAYNYARQLYKFPAEGFDVEQIGSNWGITVTKPIRETFGYPSENILTEATKTPRSWTGMLFGRYYKSADDLLSTMQRANRQIAEQAKTNLTRLLKEAGDETIGKLSAKDRLEVRRVLEYDRVFPTGVGAGEFGLERATETEFQKVFMEVHGKMPTKAQSAAYQTAVAFNDWDGIIHQLSWTRDLQRQGVEMVRINVPGKSGERSEWFPGRRVDGIDWAGKDDAVIYYHDPVSNTFQIMHKHDRTNIADFKAMIESSIKDKDFNVVQIADPKGRPLKDHLGQDTPINFLVTASPDYRPLQVGEAVPWRPGGHMIYANDHYLKQSNVVKGYKGLDYFLGDKTIIGLQNRRDGEILAKNWNRAQEILKTGDDMLLERHLNETMPWSLAEFKKMYTAGGPGGGLDPNIPVVVTRTGQETLDAHPPLKELWANIKENRTDTYDLWGNLDRTFIGERGAPLSTAANVGTEHNPMFRVEAPYLFNPWDSISRGMGNAIRSRWMSDYKTFSAEHWIAEFGNLLEPGVLEKARAAPLYWLAHADKSYAVGADRVEMAAAEGARQRIMAFIGTRSELSKDMNAIQQKAMDYLGGVRNPETWKGYIQNGVLDWISDPTTHIRAAAFHMHMGLFNPIQFWKNSQTLVNINAIVPEHGVKATFGSVLQRFILTNDNPEILKAYAKVASKALGWEEKNFIEATTAMKSTGWDNIGGEVAYRSQTLDPVILTSVARKVLDAGTMFFNESERGLRMTAWNAAYSEWRAANPAGVLNDAVKGKLLARANDLTGNMTRASNAAWQEGIFSPATQFSAYNARIMEQMLGGFTGKGRLSRAEAGRLMAAFSLMYGLPIGVGSAVGFLPLYDWTKQAAMNNNVDINSKWFVAATDGLSGYIMSLITGHQYDTGKSWGPGDSQSLVKAFNGDSTLWGIAFGPGGQTVANVASAAYPTMKAIYTASLGKPEEFPLRAEDFMRIFSEASSMNLGMKMYATLNAHKYISKNGTWVGNVTNIDALGMAMGLTPLDISNGFTKATNEKNIKEWQTDFMTRAVNDLRSAVNALYNNDNKAFDDYMKRYNAWLNAGDLTWQQRSETFTRGTNQLMNKIESIEYREQRRKALTPQAEQ